MSINLLLQIEIKITNKKCSHDNFFTRILCQKSAKPMVLLPFRNLDKFIQKFTK